MKKSSLFPLLFKSIDRRQQRKTFLSVAIFAMLWINVCAQNSANIIIQPASTTTTVGQSFTVTARVDMISGEIDDAEVHITFDKTKLQVASITKPSSSIMPNEVIPLKPIGSNGTANTINDLGQIDYNAGTTSSFPTNDFDLLSITFNVVGGGGTSSSLTYLTTFPDKTNAWRNGPSILNTTINGTVNIQNCTQPTATIAASSASSTCNGQPVTLKLASATGVGPYSLVVNGTTYNNVTVGSSLPGGAIPFPTYKIWPSTDPGVAKQNDAAGTAIEVGNKFRSSQPGFVKGLRFYRGTGTGYTLGTYKGKLWGISGTTATLLGSLTFSGVTTGTTGQWYEATFPTPVSIAANTTYLVTVYNSYGNYVATDNFFSSAVTSGSLTALANSTSTNGMYFVGGEQTGPSTNLNTWGSYLSTNYWTDVIFTPNSTTFNLTSVTDATGCNSSGALQTLNVTSVDCSTLPVTLLDLSASPNGRKVTLRWSTSTEINNRGFDVQRSTDGINWATIGFVAGVGNSTMKTNYSYLDDNLETRKYYYRLNQTDLDGRSKYSVVVSAVIGGKGEYALGQNYPNPFRNETTIQYTIPVSGKVHLSLFDMNGRTIKILVNGSKEAGTHAVSFNTGTLTSGVYYYRLQAGDFTDVKKLTIQ